MLHFLSNPGLPEELMMINKRNKEWAFNDCLLPMKNYELPTPVFLCNKSLNFLQVLLGINN